MAINVMDENKDKWELYGMLVKMVLFYAGWSGKSSLRLSFESQFDDCEEICMWVYERITPQTLGKTSTNSKERELLAGLTNNKVSSKGENWE